jgi:hypothetical protein
LSDRGSGSLGRGVFDGSMSGKTVDLPIPPVPRRGRRRASRSRTGLTLCCAVVFLFLSIAAPVAISGSTGQAAPGGDVPTSPAGAAGSAQSLEPLIDRTARRFGVELALVHAVIAAESAYNPQAVSPAGAIGLMQVMPATAADYGVTDGKELFDPGVNVRTGIRHLKRLLSKYDNDYGRAIMAYNAGEGVVDRTDSNVTYLETLNYTEAVIRHYRRNGGSQPTESALRKVALLRRITNAGQARRLLRQYLDLELPSVKALSTQSLGDLDRGLRDPLPERKPMVVLGVPAH